MACHALLHTYMYIQIVVTYTHTHMHLKLLISQVVARKCAVAILLAAIFRHRVACCLNN